MKPESTHLLAEVDLLRQLDRLVQQAVHDASHGEDTAHNGAQRGDEVVEGLALLTYQDLRPHRQTSNDRLNCKR